jgi:hypothetical protein
MEVKNEVVTITPEQFRVKFKGKLTVELFDSPGTALAHLIALAAGKREPQFVIGQQ